MAANRDGHLIWGTIRSSPRPFDRSDRLDVLGDCRSKRYRWRGR
jgi:hypothetical protein